MDRAALVEELVRTHRAHTILLYGSYARGDATAESDIDVACFAEVPETYRDARVWNEQFLDGFIHPTAMATQAAREEWLKLVGAVVLLDEQGLARSLLDRVEALDRSPLTPLPQTERQMRRVWSVKMIARIKRGDIEANYRWHWLLHQLLEDHYPMIGQRYPGPKRAFADLATRDPATLAAFERALVPGAPIDAVEALVAHLDRVWGA